MDTLKVKRNRKLKGNENYTETGLNNINFKKIFKLISIQEAMSLSETKLGS